VDPGRPGRVARGELDGRQQPTTLGWAEAFERVGPAGIRERRGDVVGHRDLVGVSRAQPTLDHVTRPHPEPPLQRLPGVDEGVRVMSARFRPRLTGSPFIVPSTRRVFRAAAACANSSGIITTV